MRLLDVGSELADEVVDFEASVSPAGEAWLHLSRSSGAGSPDDAIVVIDPEGELRAEWTPGDLGLPGGRLIVAFGQSGFAVFDLSDPQADDTDISRFDVNGNLACAWVHDARLATLLGQRDGAWLGIPPYSGDGEWVRFENDCPATATDVGSAAPREDWAPFILEWSDGTLVSAGNEPTLGITVSSIELRRGRVHESWPGASGYAVGATLAGFAGDGRAVLASDLGRDQNQFIAVDPETFTQEEWIADPSHGTPVALLQAPETTWVLNQDPETVSSLDGHDCCATPLGAPGFASVVATRLVGDSIVMVDRTLPTEPIVSRYDMVGTE